LEEHNQQELVEDGNYLGGSKGDSSKLIRMVSECVRMHPLGCGLSQGHGQERGTAHAPPVKQFKCPDMIKTI